MNPIDSILNALAEPVLIMDAALNPIVANAAFYETMMLAPGCELHQAMRGLVAEGGDAPDLEAALASVSSREQDEARLEVECQVPEGGRKILALTARRASIGVYPSEVILVELRDITQQRAAEERILALNSALHLRALDLEEVNRDLEAFTQSASHDLRSPLRLMDSIAHVLLQEYRAVLPPDAVEKVQMILNSTKEMGKLIEDLIFFARIRHQPMRKATVGMRRLVQESLDELRLDSSAAGVPVAVGELPPCTGDRALLKQVLLNLVGNAIKFSRTSPHPQIQVGCIQSGLEKTYFVGDNGVGFDEKHAQTIFLPFQRLHRDQGYEGSGLGLALVKRIVEGHGGRVWPESRTGHGTTMYFTLE